MEWHNTISHNEIKLEEPPITTYPSIANVLSLMWNHKEKNMAWFVDHFIQIVVRPNHPDTFGDFYDHADIDNYVRLLYGAAGLDWMRVNSNCAFFDTFTDYVEYEINQGFGVEACLDRFYIKSSEAYQTDRYIHSSFIYGYDKEKKEMYVADFWVNGKYSKIAISYDEMNACMDNDYIINLFKEVGQNYRVNKELMKRSFLDYLNSRDSFDRFKFSAKEYNKGLLFGLEYYDYLCSDLDKGEIPDIRMYHILHDHKKLMKCRIEYLIGQGEWNSVKLAELDSRNDSLILETEVLRNSAIKYNMSPTEKVRGNIKNRIVNLKNLDAKFMSDFLDIL